MNIYKHITIDRHSINNCFDFSHQIRTYTQQLVKDTDSLLKDLVNNNDRHLKIQRERLVDEFTAALTAFQVRLLIYFLCFIIKKKITIMLQAVQRKTVDIEKNAFREARANNYKIAKPPGSNSSSHSNKSSIFEDNFVNSRGSMQVHAQEEIDLQAMEEQERTIRDLEVRPVAQTYFLF